MIQLNDDIRKQALAEMRKKYGPSEDDQFLEGLFQNMVERVVVFRSAGMPIDLPEGLPEHVRERVLRLQRAAAENFEVRSRQLCVDYLRRFGLSDETISQII